MLAVEIALWALLAFFFWKRGLRRRYPAMALFLVVRLLAAPVLLATEWRQPPHSEGFTAGFFLYWAIFLVSAMLLYFICIEIFCGALQGFTGLMRFGIVVFRWISLAALIVSLSSTPILHTGTRDVTVTAYSLARTISILELCLLAFLCMNLNALKLRMRDMAFGLALGFGLLSANDFVLSTLVSAFATSSMVLTVVHQALVLAALAVWLVYFVLPAPESAPMVLPVNSALYRWNEIASALGHKGTQVAVQQPANSYFLSDVEQVVETVLKRTLTAGDPGTGSKNGR